MLHCIVVFVNCIHVIQKKTTLGNALKYASTLF